MFAMTQLSMLLLLLPFLASPAHAHIGSHLNQRRHQHHPRAVYTEVVAREPVAGAAEPPSMEERLARRRASRSLAGRAIAAIETCRVKGSKWQPTTTSSASTTSATTTSTAASAAATTTAAASQAVGNSNLAASGAAAAPSAAAPSASPSPAYSGGYSNIAFPGFTPNGNKAGISGGDAYDYFKDHIGWWYDWTANPTGHWGKPIAVNMLWGGGTADGEDWSRLQAFRGINWTPQYIIGFEEPDCPAGEGSAGMTVDAAVTLWNQLIAPKGWAGSVLLSPSMCKQAAEHGWLQPFQSKISKDWDITNIHVNKNSAAGIYADIDHYWNTYGKPIWVTEFACVDDSNGFVPCTDQGQINSFINTAVHIFETDSRIAGYAYSNGYGLGNVWPLMNNGQLSQSGQTYLNAIKQYH